MLVTLLGDAKERHYKDCNFIMMIMRNDENHTSQNKTLLIANNILIGMFSVFK
jgi:hypothetical protein